MKATQLDLVSTEDLIDMLMQRCQAALFIGIKPEQYSPDNYWYEISGDRMTCDGLCRELQYYIEKERERSVQAPKDTEQD